MCFFSVVDLLQFGLQTGGFSTKCLLIRQCQNPRIDESSQLIEQLINHPNKFVRQTDIQDRAAEVIPVIVNPPDEHARLHGIELGLWNPKFGLRFDSNHLTHLRFNDCQSELNSVNSEGSLVVTTLCFNKSLISSKESLLEPLDIQLPWKIRARVTECLGVYSLNDRRK